MDTTEPYYMTLLFGIARGLDRQQYALQLVTDREHLDLDNADGYIITGARLPDCQWIDQLAKPIVLLGKIVMVMILLIRTIN